MPRNLLLLPVLIALVATPYLVSRTASGAPDEPVGLTLQTLPPMEGTVKFADGSFNGFLPPRAGETFRLDFSRLPSVEPGESVALKFNPQGNSYLQIQGPLKIEAVHRHSGAVAGIRLASVGGEQADDRDLYVRWRSRSARCEGLAVRGVARAGAEWCLCRGEV